MAGNELLHRRDTIHVYAQTVRAILAGTVAVATMMATTPVASARDIEETEVSAGGCIKYYISYLDKFDDFMMTIKYHKRGAMQCSIQLTPLDSDFGPAPQAPAAG